MLLEIFDSLREWGASKSPSFIKMVVIVLGVLGLIVATGSFFVSLGNQSLAALVGGLAGIGWLVSFNLWFWFILSPEKQERFDYRSRWNLTRRRWITVWVGLVWLLAVFLIGTSTGTQFYMLLGQLNVVFLVMLAKFGVADPNERVNWSLQKEYERREKLYMKAYEDGLIDEEGNPTRLGLARVKELPPELQAEINEEFQEYAAEEYAESDYEADSYEEEEEEEEPFPGYQPPRKPLPPLKPPTRD